MPNHIQNRLRLEGAKEQISEVFDFLRSEKLEDGVHAPMDFNKITPMPEELNVTAGSPQDCIAWMLFGVKDRNSSAEIFVEQTRRNLRKAEPDRLRTYVEDAIKYRDNYKNYGYCTWYEWAIANWGTKWNAYGQPDKRNDETAIWFETAWSNVEQLIQRASRRFPAVTFYYTYADEDTGSNTGDLVIVGGKTVQENRPVNGSQAAYELAFEMRPDQAENYQLVGDSYEYVEEED
jgi:hypothetical protein